MAGWPTIGCASIFGYVDILNFFSSIPFLILVILLCYVLLKSLNSLLFPGAYDDEEAAARAYDLAALKYWGPGTLINFPVS